MACAKFTTFARFIKYAKFITYAGFKTKNNGALAVFVEKFNR